MLEKRLLFDFRLVNNIIINCYVLIYKNDIQGGYIHGTNADGITVCILSYESIPEMLANMYDAIEGAIENAKEIPVKEDIDSLLGESEKAQYADIQTYKEATIVPLDNTIRCMGIG